MRKVVLFLILWAPPLWGQESRATLSAAKTAEVGAPVILNPAGSVAPGGLEFGLADGPGPAPVVTLKSDDGQTVIGLSTAAAPGEYTFYLIAWGTPKDDLKKTNKSFAFVKVLVGKAPPPVPPGPVPPGPNPPVPPVPGGFKVVLVYDEAANNPKDVLNALYSPKVEEYLNAKTAKDEKGRPGWRRWAKTVNTDNEAESWKKIWAATKPALGKLPSVMVMTDTTGQVFEFSNEDELLALLQKAGG